MYNSVLKVIGRGHLPETVEALKEHPELKVRFGDGVGCGAGMNFWARYSGSVTQQN